MDQQDPNHQDKEQKIEFPKIKNSNQKKQSKPKKKLLQEKSHKLSGLNKDEQYQQLITEIAQDNEFSQKKSQKEKSIKNNQSLNQENQTLDQNIDKFYSKENLSEKSEGKKSKAFSDFTFHQETSNPQQTDSFTFEEVSAQNKKSFLEEQLKQKAQFNFNFSQEILKNEIISQNKQKYQVQRQLEKEVEQRKILEQIKNISVVALTGATGFLGWHVLQQLLKENYNIKISIRKQTKQSKRDYLTELIWLYPNRITLCTVDYVNKIHWQNFLLNTQCVIHCAYFHYSDNDEIANDNIIQEVEGFLILLTLCKELGILWMVLPSCLSNAINGKYRNVYNENHWSNPDYCDKSEQSKYLIEKCAWHNQSQSDNNFKLTVFLSGALMGDFQEMDENCQSLALLKNIKQFQDHDSVWMKVPLIYVVDVAKAIVDSIKSQNSFNQRYLLAQGCYWIEEVQKVLISQSEQNQLSEEEDGKPIFKFSLLQKFLLRIMSYFDNDVKKIIMMNNKSFEISMQKFSQDFSQIKLMQFQQYMQIAQESIYKLETIIN